MPQKLGRVLINRQRCPLRSDTDRLCATAANVAKGQEETHAPQQNRSRFELFHRLGVQLVEQRLGLLQIERVEPLGKPPVDRSEQFVSLLRLTLVAPEPRQRIG